MLVFALTIIAEGTYTSVVLSSLGQTVVQPFVQLQNTSFNNLTLPTDNQSEFWCQVMQQVRCAFPTTF